jgi:hypothetical protein
MHDLPGDQNAIMSAQNKWITFQVLIPLEISVFRFVFSDLRSTGRAYFDNIQIGLGTAALHTYLLPSESLSLTPSIWSIDCIEHYLTDVPHIFVLVAVFLTRLQQSSHAFLYAEHKCSL